MEMVIESTAFFRKYGNHDITKMIKTDISCSHFQIYHQVSFNSPVLFPEAKIIFSVIYLVFNLSMCRNPTTL